MKKIIFLSVLLVACALFGEDSLRKPLFISAGGFIGSKDCFTIGGNAGFGFYIFSDNYLQFEIGASSMLNLPDSLYYHASNSDRLYEIKDNIPSGYFDIGFGHTFLREKTVQPYAGIGLGFWFYSFNATQTDTVDTVLTEKTVSYSGESKLTINTAIGVQFRLLSFLDASAEVKYRYFTDLTDKSIMDLNDNKAKDPADMRGGLEFGVKLAIPISISTTGK